jgi:hypothetical protein
VLEPDIVVAGWFAHPCLLVEETGESRYNTVTTIRCDEDTRPSSLDAVATSGFLLFFFKFSLNLLFFSRLRALDILGRHIATAHLPFHELVECALWVRAEFLVCAFFGYPTVSIDADDTVRALDC